MATRAVYSFSGFPGRPESHFYLHHDGYPSGAAWRFAAALAEGLDRSCFLAAFLRTSDRAEPLNCPGQAADAEYRYLMTLDAGDDRHLQVQCWRRPPGSKSWMLRCGVMRLETFIQRFLPTDQGPGPI